MEGYHLPVLLKECIEGLDIKPEGIYVDGTLGGGGHSLEIAKRLKTGRLIGIDQDENAIAEASLKLKGYENVTFVHSNFSRIKEVLNELKIKKCDGFLLDLGVSSHQLDEAKRGFSYMQDGPLDMRMNREEALTAADIVNKYSEKKLSEIIFNFGEERWAKRIAEFIVKARSEKPIETTFELVDVIKRAIPKGARMEGPHPAKRTFQAIRIEVNNELGIIENTLLDMANHLNPGGRICVITFHSLEDRLVKNTFKKLQDPCECPKEFPVCVCGKVPLGKIVTRKPIEPLKEEVLNNPRARSAKLRIFKGI